MSWDKFKRFTNRFTWRTYANCLAILLVVCVYQNINMAITINHLTATTNRLVKINTELTSVNMQLAASHRTNGEAVVTVQEAKQLKATIAHLKHLLSTREAQVAVLQKGVIGSKTKNTLSTKNNNPLNVKRSSNGNEWKGQIGADKHGHVIFEHLLDGLRAGAIVLMKYSTVHKIDTIDGILKRFCTGNHKAYAKFLSARLNINSDEKFNIQERLPELLQAMARFESGQEYPIHYFRPFDLVARL